HTQQERFLPPEVRDTDSLCDKPPKANDAAHAIAQPAIMLFAAHEVAQSKAVHFHEDKPRYLTGPHGRPDSRSPKAGCCYAWASPTVVDSPKVAVLPASKGPVRPN
ncbi:MAG: hypothetical protein ACPHJ3_18275, partial [Rubripirellula sp.]